MNQIGRELNLTSGKIMKTKDSSLVLVVSDVDDIGVYNYLTMSIMIDSNFITDNIFNF